MMGLLDEGNCSDVPGWSDITGKTCEWYSTSGMCELGAVVNVWEGSVGYAPEQNCCVCGRGIHLAAAKNKSHTDSPLPKRSSSVSPVLPERSDSSCSRECTHQYFELLHLTEAFRGAAWAISDMYGSEPMDHAWIQHFSNHYRTDYIQVRWKDYSERLESDLDLVQDMFGCLIPIFVNWSGLLHKNRSSAHAYTQAWRVVATFLQTHRSCNFVTLSELDHGPMAKGLPFRDSTGAIMSLDTFSNLLVFGASHGHVPIPLLYDRVLTTSPWKRSVHWYIFCPCGNQPTRRYVRESLRALLGVGAQSIWPQDALLLSGKVAGGLDGFRSALISSKFCVFTANAGRSAFMISEAIQVGGCVPIYVWDDHEWLPYVGNYNFSSFGISVRLTQLQQLTHSLNQIDDGTYNGMRERMRLAKMHYTLPGFMEALERFFRTPIKDHRMPSLRRLRKLPHPFKPFGRSWIVS